MDHLEFDSERIGCKLHATSVNGVAVRTDNLFQVSTDMVVEVDRFGRFNTYVHRVSAGKLELASCSVTAALASSVGPASVTKDAHIVWKPKKSTDS